MRPVVAGGGSQNEVVQPLSLLRCHCNRLVAGAGRQNEPDSFPDRFANRLTAEPYESSFRLRMIFRQPVFEEAPGPGGGDAWFWYGMVEPLADIEGEPSSFEIIEHRPPESLADPFRCVAAAIPVLEIVFRKPLKRGPNDA